MNSIQAVIKFIAFTLWSLLLAPPQCVFLFFTRGPSAYTLPYLWQKGLCAIFGLRVEVVGTPSTNPSTLFAANHLSYWDIPVIGSVLKASFVAKREVASWPVLGFLSRLQQTAFIDRNPTAAAREAESLSGVLESGKSIILFPEGTSGNGETVKPFKSSLFALALPKEGAKPLTVQAFTLELLEVDRLNVDRSPTARDLYAWYGDMELPGHLWRFAQGSGARLRITFHPPRQASSTDDRKALAQLLWQDVVFPLYPGVASDSEPPQKEAA